MNLYTHPQPKAEKQEPVAKVSKMYVNNIQWLNQIPEVDTLLYTHPQPKAEKHEVSQESACEVRIKLDASAPLVMVPHPAFQKRTWVGLTVEERKQLWDEWENGHVVEAIEAKLKEKNT